MQRLWTVVFVLKGSYIVFLILETWLVTEKVGNKKKTSELNLISTLDKVVNCVWMCTCMDV